MSIKAESIFIGITSMEMEVNTSDYVHATVQPINATDREICWESSKEEIVSINLITGQFHANKVGDATITAFLYSDPSIKKSFDIHVKGYIPVESLSFPTPDFQIDVNDKKDLIITPHPSNATNPKVTWRSACPDIASVSQTGEITANSPGIVDIYATAENGSVSAKCEVWVRGKTPVFLIHGRKSHSKPTWGIDSYISEENNDHFNSNVNATSLNDKSYFTPQNQLIPEENAFVENSFDTEKPVNLGNVLIDNGYSPNVNLFIFNYPNQDAVIHNAKKFEKFIKTLATQVKYFYPDQVKTCFYSSRRAMELNDFKINIVGHSMGGLVARYFIENMYYTNPNDEMISYDKHVDKLITICTPHWGSGYADLSNCTSIDHKLCDHDLDFDSIMFGGNNSDHYKFDENGCKLLNDDKKCITHSYELSDELQYSKSRNTRYYAIAGIDYPRAPVFQNDYYFEMSTNYTTYQQINDFMVSKQVYRHSPSNFNAKSVGDNVVGFMSQIGWTENIGNTPNKKIPMEKIFIDVDTNGGNGGGVFIWEVVNGLGSEIFHSKAPHRTPVCDKVIEYLED